MKPLSSLLRKVKYLKLIGDANPLIDGVQFDYKKVGINDVYFALIYPGREGNQFSDGHERIGQAIQQGARVIVCENLPENIREEITYIKVENSFEVMAIMIANYYDNPAAQLKVIGVTGTNGKTSVVTLLHQLYRKLGHTAGLICTVVDKINDEEIPTDGTTPNAIELNELWRRMVDAGCEYCFMEVTSHSIFQKRLSFVDFAATVFTSLTADHIGYHGSFEEYFRVKKSLFDDTPESAFIIYNQDDPAGPEMVADSRARVRSLSTKDPNADFYFQVLENSLAGLVIETDGATLTSPLGALFNAYNLMTTYAVAVLLGEKKELVQGLLPELAAIEGRFNILRSRDNKVGVIDFAHNLGALEKLYELLEPMKTGRLITVIGCGGDRVRQRAKIGKLVYEKSDMAVFTSDNPRFEDPEEIIDTIMSEIDPDPSRVIRLVDRGEAIRYAVGIAGPGDIILIASKGHENYLEIKGVKHPFNDKQVLLEQFEQSISEQITT